MLYKKSIFIFNYKITLIFQLLLLFISQISCSVLIDSRQNVFQTNGLGEPPIMDNIIGKKLTLEDYVEIRKRFIEAEELKSIGSDIILTDNEKIANDILMSAKNDEIQKGFLNPSQFTPSQHLFNVLDQIKSSKLFNLIQKMPKGSVLHAHDTALCSTDYVISLTYRPNLWQCYNKDKDFLQLKFAKNNSNLNQQEGCKWILVNEERKKQGRKVYDEELRRHFSLYTKNPLEVYKDINDVWNKFVKIFLTITPMLTYAPIWKEYYKQALKEFYEDNVQYLELRGTLPILYDLDGSNFTQADTLQIYFDTLNEFKQENSGFYGSKLIFGPNRRVSNSTFLDYMKTVVKLKERFTNFLAGFDLVAQEDKGRPLIDFASYLLKLPDDINFFFHAGETNWYGMSTDENLIDAVLLGTKRIGHGYAIIKHPMVLETVKSKQIAIEVNPISNQVLKLNVDNRNHPCSYLFANNFPVIISSDDPSFWEATPLSHDFYIAFLGMASAHSDLRTLKQLAINSITYSSLNSAEKEIMFQKWQNSWDQYILWVINQSKKV